VERSESNPVQERAAFQSSCIRRTICPFVKVLQENATRSISSRLRRLFYLIDALFDFLHRWMQFLENFALLPGKLFDAVGLLVQLFQHGVLSLRNAMHPPKTNRPACDIQKGDKIYQVTPHRIRIVPQAVIGSTLIRLGALYGLTKHHEYR